MVKNTDHNLIITNDEYSILIYKWSDNIVVIHTDSERHEQIIYQGRLTVDFMESITNVMGIRFDDRVIDLTKALDSDEDLCDGNLWSRLIVHLEPLDDWECRFKFYVTRKHAVNPTFHNIFDEVLNKESCNIIMNVLYDNIHRKRKRE